MRALTSAGKAELMLALATFFWGWTFPVVKEAVAQMPVFAFLAWRFALAAALMTPFVLRRGRATILPAAKIGIALGAILFCAFALQTWGLALTTAANSGFFTGFNFLFVALFAAFVARRMPPLLFLSILLAGAGFFFLFAPSGGSAAGDVLTIFCAVFIAAHIIALDRWGRRADSAALAQWQFAALAVLAAASSLVFEPAFAPEKISGGLVFAFALTVLGATIFSFWAQTHFQPRTTPTRAGAIFILEPVFAALFAAGYYGETLSAAAVLGGGLVVAAMAAALLSSPRAAKVGAAAGL